MVTEYLFNWDKDLPYGRLMIIETNHELHYKFYQRGQPYGKPHTVKLSLDIFKQQMRGLGWYKINNGYPE